MSEANQPVVWTPAKTGIDGVHGRRLGVAMHAVCEQYPGITQITLSHFAGGNHVTYRHDATGKFCHTLAGAWDTARHYAHQARIAADHDAARTDAA